MSHRASGALKACAARTRIYVRISIGSYTLPESSRIRSETSPSWALEPSGRALGVLLTSAFEAGNRLIQYVVAQVCEDAPNGSTVALPLQPFFSFFLNDTFQTEPNGTTSSRYSAALEHHLSASGSFSGSSVCGTHIASYRRPSRMPGYRFRR